MTISRVNPSTWGTGTQLTSGQANGLDLNGTYALDKRAGQTDTIQSVVSCSGGGRIIGAYAVGADAATTYLVSGSNATIDVPTLTANRTYTLGTTGALAGDVLFVVMRNTSFALTIVDGGTTSTLATMSLGSASSTLGESTWGEFLYTGSAWVRGASDALRQQLSWAFTASGTWVCPPGINEIRLEGWGAGGGGGCGGNGSTTAANSASGGGGGGGALRVCGRVRVTPGTSYQVTVGSGGAGGPAGTQSAGSDGASTVFRIPAGSALFLASGAQGGIGGQSAQPPAYAPLNLGGATSTSIVGGRNITSLADANGYQAFIRTPPSFGGAGAAGNAFSTYATATAGGSSSEVGTGGTPGAIGASSASFLGGGGGGGGGAGPWDNVSYPSPTSVPNGGIAGAGGAGNSTGAGAVGNAGSAALSGGGAGGGGGGAGGQGNASGGTGGAGGAGGSGLLIIYGVH